MVTDGDVRRGLLRGIPLAGLATDIMSRAPVSAPAALPREDRLQLMRQKSIKQLPLVDEGGHLSWSRPSMSCSNRATIPIRF